MAQMMVIEAKFDGRCAICSRPTLAGMRIAKTAQGWAHESCAAGGDPPKAERISVDAVRGRVNYIYVVRGGKVAGHLRRSGEVSVLSRSEYQAGERVLDLARRLDPAAFEAPTAPGEALVFGYAVFVVE